MAILSYTSLYLALYLILLNSTMALLGSMPLLDSTHFYYTVPSLYLALLDPTALYHGSTLLDSTTLYYTLLRL